MKEEILSQLVHSVKVQLEKVCFENSAEVESEVLDIVSLYVDRPFLSAFRVEVIEERSTWFIDLYRGPAKVASWSLRIQ